MVCNLQDRRSQFVGNSVHENLFNKSRLDCGSVIPSPSPLGYPLIENYGCSYSKRRTIQALLTKVPLLPVPLGFPDTSRAPRHQSSLVEWLKIFLAYHHFGLARF